MTALLLRFALGGLNLVKGMGIWLRGILGRLDLQGWAGLLASVLLGLAWLRAASAERHWQKQSGQFEQLWTREKAALAQTTANYRAAADQARKNDAANKHRVEAEQSKISQEQSYEYQVRLAAARASYERLQHDAQAAAHPGGRGAAAVPGVCAAANGPAQAAGEDRLPAEDALTATEQAIQLDELIKWVRRQAAVDSNRTK